MIEKVLIMASGRGQRMDNLTRTRPKAMLPIMGKPMIGRVMDAFYAAGVRHYTVVVGEQDGSVADWLSRKWHVDVTVDLVPQGFERGTAAALVAARDTLDGPFILSFCDNLVSEEHVASLLKYFDQHPDDAAVLSVIKSPEEIDDSAAVILGPTGDVAYIAEKPGEGYQSALTAIAIYGFSPRVLDYLGKVELSKQGERELTSALMAMLDGGETVGYVKATWRHHITYPQDLLKVNLLYLKEGRDANILSDLPKDVHIISPVRIDPNLDFVHSGCVT